MTAHKHEQFLLPVIVEGGCVLDAVWGERGVVEPDGGQRHSTHRGPPAQREEEFRFRQDAAVGPSGKEREPGRARARIAFGFGHRQAQMGTFCAVAWWAIFLPRFRFRIVGMSKNLWRERRHILPFPKLNLRISVL